MPKDIMVEQKLFEVQAQNKERMTFWSTCICVHLLNIYICVMVFLPLYKGMM